VFSGSAFAAAGYARVRRPAQVTRLRNEIMES
jgi:hypothetical protein